MFNESDQTELESILAKLTDKELQILKKHFAEKTMSIPLNRSSFTPEEDDKLRKLVKEYGEKNWPQVASQMPGRTTRQCRERYRHYLSPHIVNGEWSQAEDDLLLQKYNEYGPKWVTIARFFKTRTDINIKNRWIVLMRRNASTKTQQCSPPQVDTNKEKKSKAVSIAASQKIALSEDIQFTYDNFTRPSFTFEENDVFHDWNNEPNLDFNPVIF